jgi:predicted NUDIX family phosphoesterase
MLSHGYAPRLNQDGTSDGMTHSTEVEHVLGLPAEVVREHGVHQGFNDDLAALDHLMAHVTLRPRPEAESDSTWKHFATYAVVCADGKALSYLRTSHGGESRLHGLRSIGIGGHVNPEDGVTDQQWSAEAIERAALRELDEEIEVPGEYRLDCIGFINDDSNPVGKVHIGLVYRCALEVSTISTAREAAITECRMLSRDELNGECDQYETWSQFLISDAIDLILS